jgi:hypothetical protein
MVTVGEIFHPCILTAVIFFIIRRSINGGQGIRNTAISHGFLKVEVSAWRPVVRLRDFAFGI